MHPLSRVPYIPPLLILLSIALVVAQMILGDANVMALWVNWIISGCVAAGIWYVTKNYHLCGIYEGKAFTISWPILSACLNFTLCHFPHTEQFIMGILLLLAMLSVLSLLLSVWQDAYSVGKHLIVGLIIGLTSTLLPHTLLWLLLLPLVSYHMRSWSTRNTFSTLTGAILGIWFVYCALFFWGGNVEEGETVISMADQMILNYGSIVQPDNFDLLSVGFGLWQWLFLGLIALFRTPFARF